MLVDEAAARFGTVVVLDAHTSREPCGGWATMRWSSARGAGETADPCLVDEVVERFREHGLHAERDVPGYAGGYITRRFGRKSRDDSHAIQVENQRRHPHVDDNHRASRAAAPRTPAAAGPRGRGSGETLRRGRGAGDSPGRSRTWMPGLWTGRTPERRAGNAIPLLGDSMMAVPSLVVVPKVGFAGSSRAGKKIPEGQHRSPTGPLDGFESRPASLSPRATRTPRWNPHARLLEPVRRQRVGDAEVRREPERLAVHHRDLLALEEVLREVAVVLDGAAARGPLPMVSRQST